MPNRIVKESIRTSDTLAEVSAEAERLFWRLVVSADDFGRFDARLNTILGQCLTPFIGKVTTEQINGWLSELHRVRLIEMYEVEGQPYLSLTKWIKHQRPRAKSSKFPAPDDPSSHPLSFDSKCLQTKTNDDSNVFVFVNGNENEFENGNENVFVVGNEDNNHDDKKVNPHEEIQIRMQIRMNKQYQASTKDYQAINDLLASKVPIQFILDGIDHTFDKYGPTKVKSFGYCAEVIKDLWALQLARDGPGQVINFEYRRAVSDEPKGFAALREFQSLIDKGGDDS